MGSSSMHACAIFNYYARAEGPTGDLLRLQVPCIDVPGTVPSSTTKYYAGRS
jgi:hypothetical protein